jgi:hypothetical protein
MNPWPLFFLVIAFTVGFAIVLGNANIEQEKANFTEIRCNFDVMLRAFLLKPDGDPRSAASFAADNFTFCVRQNARDVLMRMMSPLILVFNSQLNVAQGIASSLNILRNLKAEMLRGFQKVMDPFFRRFMLLAHEGSRVYQQMNSGVQRAYGVALSTLFLGLGVFRSIDNAISFIIKVILIILGILFALFIIMYGALAPFMALIFATSFAIATAVASTSLSGESETFCFAPESELLYKDGTRKPIEQAKVGDVLMDQGLVQGILEVDGSKTPLYNLYGIRVSGNHLVYCEAKQEWCSVRDHPDALLDSSRPCARLYCLRTTHRTLFVQSPASGQRVLFRDWEELTPEPAADCFWDSLVYAMLNEAPRRSRRIPEEDPLLGAEAIVMLKGGKRISLDKVQIGDIILEHPKDNQGTRVLGIYGSKTAACSSAGFTDGIWWKEASGSWEHKVLHQKGSFQSTAAFHLITESGTFWVETDTCKGSVRDFTEVGWLTIGETESFVKHLLSLEKNHAHGLSYHRSTYPAGGQHSHAVF